MYRRLALLSALAISAIAAGCASAGPVPSASQPHATGGGPAPTQNISPLPVPIFNGDGTIVGGLYRCFGLPPAMSGPPTRVAGTVDIFRGPLPGLPDEIVSTDGEYALRLPAGEYDLVGHWAGSNLAPPEVTVTVMSGTITPQDLVYTNCK